jgi:hypothetical protein
VTHDKFQLQFAPADIPILASRYMDLNSDEDEQAFAAGERIRAGDLSRHNLHNIFRWKTNGRGISRLARNTDAEIADALRLAISAATERSAVAVRTGLNGVHVPVASALLTAIDPNKYTVIDFRALAALGSASNDRSVNFYLSYLSMCRGLAAKSRVKLRDLDRALWQWSSEQ